MEDAFEEIDESLGSGVHDAGPGQDLEFMGRFAQRNPGRLKRIGQQLDEIRGLGPFLVDRLGPVPDNRDHRSFDRMDDGSIRMLDGPPDGFAEGAGRQLGFVLADFLAHPVDELGED